jgi:hypothetical protein
MKEQTTLNNIHHIAEHGAPTAASGPHPPSLDADLALWLDEAARLIREAEFRLRSGEVLPALSSLSAVTPLHGMLMGRCSEMLEDAGEAVHDGQCGLYL